MAIQHLTSSTANKRPTPAAMADAQIAINSNTASPGLFFKDSAGALIKVGPVHVGTTAPNASPASGGQTGNSVGEQWLDTTGGTYVFKVWDGSAWRSETGTFVDVNGDTMTGALGIIAGSASTPGLFVTGDTNTGIYSPGADQLAISTNGTQRLLIEADGDINIDSGGVFYDATNNTLAIGVTSNRDSTKLDVLGNIAFGDNAGYYGTLAYNAGTGHMEFTSSDGGFKWIRRSGSATSMVIDSSGRLLVGTSTARANFENSTVATQAQVEGTGTTTSSLGLISNSGTPGGNGPFLYFARSKGSAVGSNDLVSADDHLGGIAFQGSDGSEFVLGATIRAEVDGTPGANDMPTRLVFSTTADGAASPTERMRITNAGHILFGTTDADAGINGTPSGAAIGSFKVGSGEGFRVSSTGAHYWNFANDGSVHIFRRNGTNVGSITVSSGATAYNTSSDYRLKENVVPLTGAANRVNQLHVHRFNFIADPNKTVDGFIAHEAQAVVPECVTGTKDAVDADGNPVYQGIDQSKLVPLLTAALQEALAEIESLKARVTALEP